MPIQQNMRCKKCGDTMKYASQITKDTRICGVCRGVMSVKSVGRCN